MADGATLLTGQSVLLNVEEEFRQEIEPVQTLLRQTEELTVKETALKQENVTHKAAWVISDCVNSSIFIRNFGKSLCES